jgi:serine/threonine protein kinase
MVGPGSPVYAAPEASTPPLHPKMDIFSFGVLLVEFSLKFPEVDN